eukprot:gb/GEZN01004827.1/.p1 GENE.gb/GEZN01004827.1/~~gb/GEZN01004827.1/.p1  ORF type:complete len:450 (-),score=57.23 gb/GEZN01004827.1/:547-1851(-)
MLWLFLAILLTSIECSSKQKQGKATLPSNFSPEVGKKSIESNENKEGKKEGKLGKEGKLSAAGCETFTDESDVASALLETISTVRARDFLETTLVNIRKGNQDVVVVSLGQSMPNVNATSDVNFLNGNVAFGFVAISFLKLCLDDKRCSLDDTIDHWLPEWSLHNGESITIRQLLKHTSGYRDYVPNTTWSEANAADPFRPWKPKELIDWVVPLDLWYLPGTGFSYSHVNYQILGLILEKVTGETTDRTLQKIILNPAKLLDTHPVPAFTNLIPDPVLHYYTTERGVLEEATFWTLSYGTPPGSVLTTTICDLGRTASVVGGNSARLLSPTAFAVLGGGDNIGLGPAGTCVGNPECLSFQQTSQIHYCYGFFNIHGWYLMNPFFSGLSMIVAYYPVNDVSVAIVTTSSPNTPGAITSNHAQKIFDELMPILITM